jgi:hypothetical protein
MTTYVPKVNAEIRCIKERYHSVKNGLPWSLPPDKVKDQVADVVSRINMEHSAAINLTVAPTVLVIGMWLDFPEGVWLGNGDYCEVYDGMDNTSKP